MKRLIQLGAFVLALAIAIPALAMGGLEEAKQKLDTVKQQGLVGGETPTGYLDVVRAEGDAQAVVKAINQLAGTNIPVSPKNTTFR